jgi:dihydrolipoamide dehydrogenase
MSKNQYDLIVLGGGPGGYVAAIRASQLGMNVALIEANHLGGICLNWGCIPTKALLRCSEINHLITHADKFGFNIKDYSFDIKKIVKRSRDVASQLSGGISHLLKKNKVTVYDGFGRLNGPSSIDIFKDDKKTHSVSAPHIILATGARARVLPGFEPDGKVIWTYKEAMVPDDMPGDVVVVGSGAIGIEFASFYKNMGANVTVLEVMDRILPAEDEEISEFAAKQFKKQGMNIITSAKLDKISPSSGHAQVTYELNGKSHSIKTDRVIMAVGITGNIEDIGLESTKVKTDRGHIVVNEWLETDQKGVYAIGDLVGPPWLAHKASHEGIICVEKIAGKNDVHPLNVTNIPGCTYCMPQIASVGLSESKAKEKGYKIKVGRFPFQGNGKAIALGEPEGLVKTIFDAKTGELLGAHMIGAEVTEMIQGYSIAKTLETTEQELIHSVFPHPTLSEMMHESVLDAYDRVIHF